MNPRLLVVTGPDQGVSYPIASDSFTIGRSPRNLLPLVDMSASREHCVIQRQGDAFVIRDLGSLHGTLVNDERITESVLVDGDSIKIGRIALQFLTSQEAVWQE
ncbi:MAG: FHA domain-containing protein, partial [Bryobacteraceae bacterium]